MDKLVDTFRVVYNKPIEYRFDGRRIVSKYGSIGFSDRPMSPGEAASLMATLPSEKKGRF